MVKGKEEEAFLNPDEKEDPDMPKFNIPKNMSQITVNIGPIKLQDLHAQELHQMFKASHAFSITFEKKDLDSTKKEHVGYVRLPFEFKTSTYLICVYNKLKNLRISGRDMSVNFPQEFVKLVEAAKKHQEEARKKLLSKKDIVQAEEEAKKKSVYVNNIPPNTSEDALKTLFPDSANVIIPKNSEGTSYGLAILEFDSADAAMMCIETSDEMELNGYKLKFSLAVSSKTESPKKINTENKDTHPSGNKESKKSTDDKKNTKDDSRLKSSQSVRSSTSSTPGRRDSSASQKSPAIGADTKSRYSDAQKSSKSTPTSQQSRKRVTTASSATTTTTTTSTSWAGKKELQPKSSTTSNQRAVGGRGQGSNVGSRRMQQPGNAGVMKTHGTTPQKAVPYGAGRGSTGSAIPTISNRKTVPPSVGGVMINRMVTPNNSMMSPSGTMVHHQGATIATAAGMMSQPHGMMSQPHGMMTSQGQGMVSMAAIRMVSPGVMMQPSNQMIIPVGPGRSQAGGMMPHMLTGGSVAVPSLIARTQQIMANTPAIGGRVFSGGPQTALRDTERLDHSIRVDHRDDWQKSPERRDDRSRHSSHERQRPAVLREDRRSPDRSQRSSLHGNDRDRWSQPRLADERHYERENWRGSGKSRGTGRPRYERSPERDQGLPFEKSHRSEDELAELKSQVEIIEETLNRVTGRGPFSPGFDDPQSFDGTRPNIRDRSPDLRDRGPILHDDHPDFRDRVRHEFHDTHGFEERLSDISLPEYESVDRKRRHSFDEGRHEFDRNRRDFSPDLERDRLDDRDRSDERGRFTDWRDDCRVDFPESPRDMIVGHLPREMDLRYPLDPQVEFGPSLEKRPYYDGMDMERERHEGDMGFGGINNPHFDDRVDARFGRDDGLQSPRKDRPFRGGRPFNRRGGKRGQGRGGRGRGH